MKKNMSKHVVRRYADDPDSNITYRKQAIAENESLVLLGGRPIGSVFVVEINGKNHFAPRYGFDNEPTLGHASRSHVTVIRRLLDKDEMLRDRIRRTV